MTIKISDIRKRREAKNRQIGCLGLGASFLSFIPLIGLFTGIITIIWGIREWNYGGKRIVMISAAGILLMTVGLYSYLFLQLGSTLNTTLDDTVSNQMLPSIVQSIEYFKIQNGRYPKDLVELKENSPSLSFFNDPLASDSSTKRDFYYELDSSGEFYYLFSIGKDKIPYTQDDVLPKISTQELKKIGLRLP